MKKQFLNLGKALNKAEQKQINGGGGVSGTGVCIDSNGRLYHVSSCDNLCRDGSRPFCYA